MYVNATIVIVLTATHSEALAHVFGVRERSHGILEFNRKQYAYILVARIAIGFRLSHTHRLSHFRHGVPGRNEHGNRAADAWVCVQLAALITTVILPGHMGERLGQHHIRRAARNSRREDATGDADLLHQDVCDCRSYAHIALALRECV